MRVLIADDDDGVLLALEMLLRREGMETSRAQSPCEVLEALKGTTTAFDALLLDLNYAGDTTSGREGYSLLEALRRLPVVSPPAVVMTAWATIEGAVEAMRSGAVDYVPKPWDNARLVELLRGLVAPARTARSRVARGFEWAPLSSAMRELYAMVDQVAVSDLAVLVTGEHGVGKELIARAVHERSGRRGRFVTLNAGALPEGTLESELFGHVRGAFTDAKSARTGAFSQADGGTLFLDEIATMPMAQQAKLLRVLQQGEYQPLGASSPRQSTARIVSATNADVGGRVAAGAFRADLLYRLNTIHLEVPPLRERREEIPGLCRHFVEREATRHGLRVPVVEADALKAMQRHPWPGNVRELEHALQRAVLLSARSGRLAAEHLGLPGLDRDLQPLSPASSAMPHTEPTENSLQTVRDAERSAILRALELHPRNRRAAAESLGLSRSAFYRRLTQYGIRPWE